VRAGGGGLRQGLAGSAAGSQQHGRRELHERAPARLDGSGRVDIRRAALFHFNAPICLSTRHLLRETS
jgi:hypothetical protein